MLDPFQISLIKKEIRFQTSRSGGKGGQNVNKVETKVELLFDILHSAALNNEEKNTITPKLKSKINDDGILKLTESASRSQLQNKEAAIEKLVYLINKALVKQKIRKATRPSKASKLKKSESKKKISEKKQWRKKLY